MSRPVPKGWVLRTSEGATTEGELRAEPHWFPTLVTLVRHEFRLRYRARALGVVWSFAQPVVMMGLLSVVLGRVAAVKDYPIHLLIGLIFWNFISTSVNASVGSLVAKADVVQRSMLPRQLFPLSVMLSYTVNLAVESLALLAFIPLYPGAFRLSAALLVVPVVLVLLVVLLAGAVLLGSVLNVLYRDVGYLVTTSLLILFWLTPIVYALDGVAEPYQTILRLNPLTGMLVAIRGAVMEGAFPSLITWATMLASSAIMAMLGAATFRRLEKKMLDGL